MTGQRGLTRGLETRLGSGPMGGRTLLHGAVLRVQDGAVVYPSCSRCCSRIDRPRCACSKCGYTCLQAQVGYRYRLSLRVARETSIFGVTVFGTCLDPFFGIHASGLQRLMEEEEETVEAAARAALLKQAVDDCFIGRHLIFGIKVNNTGSSPRFDGSGGLTGGTTAGPAQFIATQVLLPPAGGGAGCSVLRYYRALLQRAGSPGFPGSSEAFRPAAPLLLPLRSPGRAARTAATTPPRLLSPSLHRLLYSTVLSPDSPWQRSPGVVTSSAEQDAQKDEDDEPPHHHRPPPNQTPAKTQKAPPTALPSANERGFSIGRSFPRSPWSPDASSTLPHHAPPRVNQSPDRWPQRGIDAPANDPLAWEDDMPFSESLEAFIVCQENPPESRTASHRSARHSCRRTPADVSNTCAPSRAREAPPESARRVSAGACTGGIPPRGGCSCPVSCEPMGAQGFCVDDPGPARDEDGTDDVYNCSADLFSDPMAVVTVATQVLGTSAGTSATDGRTTVTHKDTQTLDPNPEAPAYTQRRAGSNLDSAETAAPSGRRRESSALAALQFLYTPHRHGGGSSRTPDSNPWPPLRRQTPTDDIIHGSHPDPLAFIPPSQSTPLPRTRVRTGSGSAAGHRTRAASRPPPQPPRPPHIITTTPSRPPAGRSGSHRFTASPVHHGTQRYLERDPVESSKTPARKNNNQNLKLTSRRRLRNLDRATTRGLTARQTGKLQRPVCFPDVSVTVMCVSDDRDNNDMVVTLPTIGEMSLPVSARQGEHADGCVGQTPSWEISGTQTKAVDSTTWGRSAEGVTWDGGVHHFDQSPEFDLSRDLFADSFH